MGKVNYKYLLEERGRYFYQRKVPLDLQVVVGRKKWRAPLGGDAKLAIKKLGMLEAEHDELIRGLGDPETRQDFKTKTRRAAEEASAAKIDLQEKAYKAWCHANRVKTDEEKFKESFPEVAQNFWKDAQDFVSGVEKERLRHLPPTEEHLEQMRLVFEHVEKLPPDNRGRFTLPPFAEFRALVSKLPTQIQDIVGFENRLPEPMDDDECFDRLSEIHEHCFGRAAEPPSDPDERDQFDFAKMALERKIARVARDPDTLNDYRLAPVGFAICCSKY